jgi:hypothetical protein
MAFAQYDAGNVELHPTEMGTDAALQAARRVGTFYHQEGENLGSAIATAGKQAEDFMAHREISHGAVGFAGMQQDLTQKWNDQAKNADPNDPTVAKKFQDEVIEPAIQKYSEGFMTEAGQRWAEQHVDALRSHLFEKTSADMSTLAGIAAKTNVEKTVNSLSSTVATDPSSLDFAMKTVDGAIGGIASSSPNLSPTQAAQVSSELSQKAKEQIVKSAVAGMIMKNPGVDLDGIQKKYGDYINGAEMKQFQKAAQTQAKANTLQDKQIQVAQRQLADLNVHKGAAEIMAKNITFDPTTGHPIVDPNYFQQVLELAKNNPNASNAAETARTMLTWGETQQNKANKIVDDPIIKKDLTDRMFDPDRPTSRVDLMKAQADGKLSNQSFQAMDRLVKEMETTPLHGDIWKSTTQAVRDRLIRMDLPEGRDAVGAANYSSFMQDFLPQYIAKSRAGTLEPNALNLNDPKSMISQSLAPYKSSMQDRLRAQSTTPAPPPAPAAASDKPPVPDARKAPDGNWYVQKDGKYFRVN